MESKVLKIVKVSAAVLNLNADGLHKKNAKAEKVEAKKAKKEATKAKKEEMASEAANANSNFVDINWFFSKESGYSYDYDEVESINK